MRTKPAFKVGDVLDADTRNARIIVGVYGDQAHFIRQSDPFNVRQWPVNGMMFETLHRPALIWPSEEEGATS